MERNFAALKPADKRCTLTVTGGINRPPMERTRGTVALYHRARALAAELGFHLDEAATGGASDGNFTSALGFPRSTAWARSAKARTPLTNRS